MKISGKSADLTFLSWTKTLIAMLGVAAFAAGAYAIDLNGTYMRLGVNSDGSLINDSQTLGARFPDSPAIEFLLPGNPYEGWAVGANGNLHLSNFAPGDVSQIPVTVTNTSSGTTKSVVVTGTANFSGGQSLAIRRTITFDASSTWATFRTELTNTGTIGLTRVTFMEGADPDQGAALNGSTNTNNDIIFDGHFVRAWASGPAFPSGLTMGLGTCDPRAILSVEDPWTVNPYDVLNSPRDPSNSSEDAEICLAFDFGTLGVGQTVSAEYYMIFGRTVDEADTEFKTICPECPFEVAAVVPPEDLASSGAEGGPFTPASKDYTLTNVSADPIEWTAAATMPWLSVAPSSGMLLPGRTGLITISLNAAANTLPPGDYNDVIHFTDTATGCTMTRPVNLHVSRLTGEIEVTDSIAPADDMNMPFGKTIIGKGRAEQIIINNTNTQHSLIVTDISLGGASGASGTPELSVVLPAHSGSSEVSEGSYVPASWANPPSLHSKLVIRGGYKALNAGMNVLVLAAGDNPTFLRTSLTAFPDVSKADYFDCRSAVPDLGYLSGYDVVVVMSQNAFYNATGTGDVLADYVDGGGKVIEAVATFGSGGGWELAGRFVTGDYSSFSHGPGEFFDHSLGAFDSAHPIMDGVTSLTDAAPAGVILKAEADWVASWNNSTPLAATRNDSVVGINIFAFDSGTFTGDVALLFHNAAVWLAQTSEGFSLTGAPLFPAVIPPLSNITVGVIFEPNFTKDYKSSVLIKSDDTDEPEVAVQLTGTGVPDYLTITPDANLTFSGHLGGPFVPSNASYQLDNNSPISINWSAEPNVPWLNVSPASGILAPGNSAKVTVSPNSQANLLPKGYQFGSVNFTNLTTTVRHTRPIVLNVYTEPKTWTRPLAFNVSVPQGDEQTQILTIGNSGDGILNFALSSLQTSFTPAQQPSVNTAESDSNAVYTALGHDFTLAANAPYALERLLVRFAPKADGKHPNKHEKEQILASLGGGTVKHEFNIVPGLALVNLPSGHNVKDALKTINKHSEIVYAEPDYEIKLSSHVPNDPDFGQLWGMNNTGQSGGINDADIDAPEAWDVATGGKQIIVAVIDTGVDYTHPDLAANIWTNTAELNGIPGVDDDGNGYIDDIHGYDFYNFDPDPIDDAGHGTHCSGTIGAVGNNGQGVAGVCWNTQIMALKFLSSYGSGSDSGAISCIEYAIKMGARVASMSWGSTTYSQALKDAIDKAGNAGILCVAAAGNDYGNNNDVYPHYPSSYVSENIIAVLATDSYDNMSYFSNYGPTSVDLGAPGSDIYSCVPGGYAYYSGTSMATPHVSGACALLWSINPGLDYSAIKDTILKSVDSLPVLNGQCVSGGRLNINNAVRKMGSQWIQFGLAFGSVNAHDSNNITVKFNAERPAGVYKGEITIASNDPYTPQIKIPVTMTVEPVDYMTELFDPNSAPNGNDTAYKTLTFSPVAKGGYGACISPASAFPVDPAGGTILYLDDDDYVPVTIEGNYVPFFGYNYDTFYIGSNGYISFDSGDTRLMESLASHFDLPRISALFDDLDPSAGGVISWKMLKDRVVVTFENVHEYNSEGVNSFQIEMRFNGKIRMTFLGIAAKDGLVGLSEGYGLPPYFTQCDLTRENTCSFQSDLNGDQNTDLLDFSVLAKCRDMQFSSIVAQTIRDEFNTVSYSGNNGTQNWTNNWQELGESDGPTAGILQVNPGYMNIGPQKRDSLTKFSLTRQADLSRGTAPVLSYNYAVANNVRSGSADVKISADGGLSWTALATYTFASGSGSASFDIAPFASPTTQVRFELGGKTSMSMHFDNVQIQYQSRPHYEPSCAVCDFNQDLTIDLTDLQVLVEHWLE